MSKKYIFLINTFIFSIGALAATILLTYNHSSGYDHGLASPTQIDFGLTFLIGAICTFAFILVNQVKIKVDLLTISFFLALISIIFSLFLKSEQGALVGFVLFLLTGFIYSLITNAFRSNFITRYFVGSFTYFFLKIKSLFNYVKDGNISGNVKNVRLEAKDVVLTGILFFVIGMPLILLELGLLASVNPNFANFLSFEFIGRTIFFSIAFVYLASELYLLKTLPKEKELLTKPKADFDVENSKLMLRVVLLILIVLNIFYIFFIGADLGGEITNARNHFDRTSFSSFSEYSVSRFWALIQVTLINLVIIYLVTKPFKVLTKENSNILRPAITVNLILTVFLTFGLIFSTLARFGLYIQGYGITHDRLYGITFAVLIGAILSLFAYGAFTKKHTKFQLISFALLLLYFAVMNIIPMNYFTNKVNYELYKAGAIKVFNTNDIIPESTRQNSKLEIECRYEDPLWDGFFFYRPSEAENYLVAIDIVKEDNPKLSPKQRDCLKAALSQVYEDQKGKDVYEFENWNIISEIARRKLEENKQYFTN